MIRERGKRYHIVCGYCGERFESAYADKKYCSEKCKRRMHYLRGRYGTVEKWQEERQEERYAPRPVTADTAFLVQKWYREGDSLEEIAQLLERDVSQIRELLNCPLTKYQLHAMEECILKRGDLRGRKTGEDGIVP